MAPGLDCSGRYTKIDTRIAEPAIENIDLEDGGAVMYGEHRKNADDQVDGCDPIAVIEAGDIQIRGERDLGGAGLTASRPVDDDIACDCAKPGPEVLVVVEDSRVPPES